MEATDWRPRIGNPRLGKAHRRSDVQIMTRGSITLFLRPLDAGHFPASDFQSVAPLWYTAGMEKNQWLRPALWFTLAFNILACVPTLQLLGLPAGSEQMSDDLDGGPHGVALFIATITFLAGFPLAFWQFQKRAKLGYTTLWERTAMVLCLTPYPLAMGLLSLILQAKSFDSLG